jgi:hypothetical protein
MSAKFYLRITKQKKTIYFEYRNENIRFRSSTLFQVNNISSWDAKKCKLKIPSQQPNAILINEKLDAIKNGFERHLIDNKKFNSITNEECKNAYEELISDVLGVKTKSKKLITEKEKIEDVVNYFDFYIDKFTKVPSESTKKLIKKDSMKSYTSSKKVIESYLATKALKKLKFEDINREFYYDFIAYLYEKNYSTNYIGTIIQKLKTIMKSSFDFDLHTNLEFQKSYFSKFKEKINHPYLDLTELEIISKLSLDDKKDDTARDIFIIQCNSGFRIQDLLDFIKNPKYSNTLKGDKLMHKEQNKTGKEVFAPLNKNIRKILEKRNGELPPYMPKAEINYRIKDICKKANIITPYTIKRTEGREKIELTKPKCDFICTHTARRSFCTNAYMSGIPPHIIMLISGHKSELTFMLYIKADLKLKASKFSDYQMLQ